MPEQVESIRRKAPVTVLTLLFGLLLGFAGGTGAQLQAESAGAQLTLGENLRRSAGVRIPGSEDERPDPRDATGLLPPSALVVTELVSLRPVAAASGFEAASRHSSRPVPYQARAPPAA